MPIIEVQNVVKEFQLGQLKSIKNSLFNTLNRIQGKPLIKQKPFRALDDISFSIESGEVVGVVGTNGAGKSTLLKLLSRIIVPTRGTLAVNGTVAPLIEVGAGLHPDLTGRENIYLNGAIMGIPAADLRRKFDEIVAFAELEEFIDTPIKRYSTGMAVRLGFSIATSVDADILIVDEVLAVGDLAFQRKCFDRMENLIKRSGKTVFLVSHNIRQIQRICNRVILLNHGSIVADGIPTDVCNLFYDKSNEIIHSQSLSAANGKKGVKTSGELDILSVTVRGVSDGPSSDVEMYEDMTIDVKFEVFVELDTPEILVGIHTTDFFYVTMKSTATLNEKLFFPKGCHSFSVKLDKIIIKPGSYGVSVLFFDRYRREIWSGENLAFFKVLGSKMDWTKMPRTGVVDVPADWDFINSSVDYDKAAQ